MTDNTIKKYECLGQVLDGCASRKLRNGVAINMTDSIFKECFMVALKATQYFKD